MLYDDDSALRDVPINGVRPSLSAPFLTRVSNSFLSLKRPLLVRGSSTSDRLFSGEMSNSPLFDLPPVALPGLASRVSRNDSVAKSLDLLSDAFEEKIDPDDVVQMCAHCQSPFFAIPLSAIADDGAR